MKAESPKRGGADRNFLKMVELLRSQNRKLVELLGPKLPQEVQNITLRVFE